MALIYHFNADFAAAHGCFIVIFLLSDIYIFFLIAKYKIKELRKTN